MTATATDIYPVTITYSVAPSRSTPTASPWG